MGEFYKFLHRYLIAKKGGGKEDYFRCGHAETKESSMKAFKRSKRCIQGSKECGPKSARNLTTNKP